MEAVELEALAENLALELLSLCHQLDIFQEVFRKKLNMGNRVLERGLSKR